MNIRTSTWNIQEKIQLTVKAEVVCKYARNSHVDDVPVGRGQIFMRAQFSSVQHRAAK
jgi:hypothetical protein